MPNHMEWIEDPAHRHVGWLSAEQVEDLSETDTADRGGIAIDTGSSTVLIVGSPRELRILLRKMEEAIPSAIRVEHNPVLTAEEHALLNHERAVE